MWREALSDAALAFARRLNPTSTPSSPPPSTTPAPTPDLTSMMTMISEMMTKQMGETRKLVMGLMYPSGESRTTNSQSIPMETSTADPWQPYDAMDLSPELEAVMAREAQENEYERSQRERVALQARLREAQAEELRLLEDQSEGPWSHAPDANGAG